MDQENDQENEQENKPEVTMEQVLERMAALEESNVQLKEVNASLYSESKARKQKLKDYKTTVESERETQLEDDKNWKDLLQIEKAKRLENESELKNTRKTVLQKELNFKVASMAKDAHDVSDIIASLPKDLISIDEDNLSIAGVSEAVNHVRESKPWLFVKEAKSGMSSARPDGTSGKQNYSDLDDAGKDAIFHRALEGLVLPI